MTNLYAYFRLIQNMSKRTVYITQEMIKAKYNPFPDICFFCNSCHPLPDKNWCLEHDTEITKYGNCETFEFGESVKEIIAKI